MTLSRRVMIAGVPVAGNWGRAVPRPIAVVLFCAVVVSMVGTVGCESWSDEASKKVLILGCDGMDPKLVRRMLAEGRLPNMAKLAKQGGFEPLTTSIPPQSPVAWSNFITGAGPGVHGIFDFIHRDPWLDDPDYPDLQIVPYWSGNMVMGVDEEDMWQIGDYQIPPPWVEGKNELMRRGTPFWSYLDAAGVPVQMYRIPADYPPTPSKHGNVKTLAGMGVPDAMGTQGTYQHFTTRPRRESRPGGGIKLRLRKDYSTGGYTARLRGPVNEMLVKSEEMEIELRVDRDPVNDVVKIAYENEGVAGDQTVEIVLNVGEWSEWEEFIWLKTKVGPAFKTMARIYLQQVRPNIEFYVTPLNFVPTEPGMVFCEPDDFVVEIGEEIGNFYTQGFAEDFKARDTGVFTDAEYKVQADKVMEERFRIMDYALDHFEEGLLFFYFSSSDLQAHIFWWDSEEPHPVRTPEEARKYQGVIEDVYVRMDDALGECMEHVGDDATVIMMSDHGFANFRRGVSVNTWLREQGYLTAKKNLTFDADWSKTRAYGMGVNCSIYLNLKGRERLGIVDPSERTALLDEITQKLLALYDPDTGKPVVRRVYRSDECYSGPEAKDAPDLIIGYERGYRASWNSCLGEFDRKVIVDNNKAWSADHCIAHDLVPGILLSNRRINRGDPALIDVAPTVLEVFGVSRPEHMTGRSFFGELAGKKDNKTKPVVK